MSEYIGYSGYYHIGELFNVEGELVCVFGYRLVNTKTRGEYQALQGVASAQNGLTIQVMGTDNPFEQRYKVKLEGGATYRVGNSSEELYNNYGDYTQIMQIVLVKS